MRVLREEGRGVAAKIHVLTPRHVAGLAAAARVPKARRIARERRKAEPPVRQPCERDERREERLERL